MRFQLLTSLLGAVLSFIGIQFVSDSLAISWWDQLCFSIIAGIYTYISTVHILPQVIEENYGMKGAVSKIGAFAISVLIMLLLNKYE